MSTAITTPVGDVPFEHTTKPVMWLACEVTRLRQLIKDADGVRCMCPSSAETGCPWCGEHGRGVHEADCPAFTPSGEVK